MVAIKLSRTLSCLILGLFLTALSGLNLNAMQTTQYVMTISYGFPLSWLVEVSGDGTVLVSTNYYFQLAGFIMDLLIYSATAYAFFAVVEHYSRSRNDAWEIIFFIIIVLAVVYKLHAPLLQSNILHDRPLFEGVFGFGDRPAFDNMSSLIENATPMKQKLVGLLGTISSITDWVIGTFVAAIMLTLAKKADWKILNNK